MKVSRAESLWTANWEFEETCLLLISVKFTRMCMAVTGAIGLDLEYLSRPSLAGVARFLPSPGQHPFCSAMAACPSRSCMCASMSTPFPLEKVSSAQRSLLVPVPDDSLDEREKCADWLRYFVDWTCAVNRDPETRWRGREMFSDHFVAASLVELLPKLTLPAAWCQLARGNTIVVLVDVFLENWWPFPHKMTFMVLQHVCDTFGGLGCCFGGSQEFARQCTIVILSHQHWGDFSYSCRVQYVAIDHFLLVHVIGLRLSQVGKSSWSSVTKFSHQCWPIRDEILEIPVETFEGLFAKI